MKQSLVFISLIILFAYCTEKRIQYVATYPHPEIDTIFLGKGLVAYGDTIKLSGEFTTSSYPEFPDTIGCVDTIKEPSMGERHGDSIYVGSNMWYDIRNGEYYASHAMAHLELETVVYDTVHILLAIVDTNTNSRVNDLARQYIKEDIFFMWAEYGYDVIARYMTEEDHIKYLDENKIPITNYFVQPLTKVK